MRREQLTAKTIEEIHRDVAREERQKEQMSQGNYRGGGNNRGGGGDYRGGKSQTYTSSNRGGGDRSNRPAPVTDSSGFTSVGRGKGSFAPAPVRVKSSSSSSSKHSSKQSSSSSSKSSSRKAAKEPASTPKAALPPPLDKEKLELRIKNIANEFIADQSNISELFLSFDEILGTPDASQIFTQKNIDRIVDCKNEERIGIVTMLVTLYGVSKITAADVQLGLGELIEFIDSYAFDCPKIFEYVGDIISKFIHLKALNVLWICSSCNKMLEMSPDKEKATEHIKIMTHTVRSLKSEFGDAEAKAVFLKEESALVKLLGKANWDNLKESI